MDHFDIYGNNDISTLPIMACILSYETPLLNIRSSVFVGFKKSKFVFQIFKRYKFIFQALTIWLVPMCNTSYFLNSL